MAAEILACPPSAVVSLLPRRWRSAWTLAAATLLIALLMHWQAPRSTDLSPSDPGIATLAAQIERELGSLHNELALSIDGFRRRHFPAPFHGDAQEAICQLNSQVEWTAAAIDREFHGIAYAAHYP